MKELVEKEGRRGKQDEESVEGTEKGEVRGR